MPAAQVGWSRGDRVQLVHSPEHGRNVDHGFVLTVIHAPRRGARAVGQDRVARGGHDAAPAAHAVVMRAVRLLSARRCAQLENERVKRPAPCTPMRVDEFAAMAICSCMGRHSNPPTVTSYPASRSRTAR
mmetsp:Transcript_21438/g.66517  ORF Transcript_21438/g.66517 Transcript_21438/m.66517 type:complete len:130 (+) Transcript_21438:89-478(+)